MRDEIRLLALGLGTFHVVLLTALLVLALYLTTDLGEALAELDTAVGLAIFAALWGTSVYCTYRGLKDADFDPCQEANARSILNSGFTWGAWNGVLFFWLLLAAGLAVLLLLRASEGGDQVAGVLVFGVIAFGVGTILATIIGYMLGVVFAVIDLELLRLARWLSG